MAKKANYGEFVSGIASFSTWLQQNEGAMEAFWFLSTCLWVSL